MSTSELSPDDLNAKLVAAITHLHDLYENARECHDHVGHGVLQRPFREASLDSWALRKSVVRGTMTSLLVALDEVKAERDRLQDILDCETGKRAPEGWESCFAVEYEGDDESREMPYLTLWQRSADGIHCYASHGETTHPKRWWSVLDCRGKPKLIGRGEADTMLEAIEAADRAAKENA